MQIMIQLELINVFISSTALVLKNYGLTLRKERLTVDEIPKTTHEINVVFGIGGAISSTIVMGLSIRGTKKLATLILRGPVYDLAIAGNTVSMIGTDIATAIVSNMQKIGIDVCPTPTTMVDSMGVVLSTLASKKVAINFDTEVGQIDLRITLE